MATMYVLADMCVLYRLLPKRTSLPSDSAHATLNTQTVFLDLKNNRVFTYHYYER